MQWYDIIVYIRNEKKNREKTMTYKIRCKTIIIIIMCTAVVLAFRGHTLLRCIYNTSHYIIYIDMSIILL